MTKTAYSVYPRNRVHILAGGTKTEVKGSEPVRPDRPVIRTALQAAGVEFIADTGGWPGVRLRKMAEY
jgi:hypothetical protein